MRHKSVVYSSAYWRDASLERVGRIETMETTKVRIEIARLTARIAYVQVTRSDFEEYPGRLLGLR